MISPGSDVLHPPLTDAKCRTLATLEVTLQRRVMGQEAAIAAVCRAVRRAPTGLKDPRQPIGSFLFLGPTGVGKTEVARALAAVLFGDETALLAIDMSEFMEKHEVARLVGSPPGYIGHEEGGQLTKAVRDRPSRVILFDEIEKAHPDIFHILLQVLEEGRLTDGQGRTVSFRHTLIILTSNIGAASMLEQCADGTPERGDEMARRDLTRTFRPEFLNRLDDVCVFRPLTPEAIARIVDLHLGVAVERVEHQGIQVHVTPAARAALQMDGYDPAYGARPLKRLIQRVLLDQVAAGMVARPPLVLSGDHVALTFDEDQGYQVLPVPRASRPSGDAAPPPVPSAPAYPSAVPPAGPLPRPTESVAPPAPPSVESALPPVDPALLQAHLTVRAGQIDAAHQGLCTVILTYLTSRTIRCIVPPEKGELT